MLLELFLSFVQIGAFSFGGGLAALPLIQNQIVELHGWMTLTQFTDLISIAEMTPGPIAVNSATFVGLSLAGVHGAIIATLGCLLPACIFVAFLGFCYYKFKDLAILQGVLSGLRPAVVSMISVAGITIFLLAMFGEKGDSFNIVSMVIFLVAFIILRLKKFHPILVLLGSGVIGCIVYSFIPLV